MKRVIKLINSERLNAKIVSAKACETGSYDSCTYNDDADCKTFSYDRCGKDHALCYNYGYDYCSYIDDTACSGDERDIT